MSGKEFFTSRYERLGWKPRGVSLRQAIRLNKTNSKDKNLKTRLEEMGVHIEEIPFLDYGYWVLASKVSVGATAEYLLGMYSIQEAAAQIPASIFANLKNKKVLDAAAAPGGKTVQLADLMENTGAIVALDVDKRRLTALANHLERCHTNNTVIYLMDARNIAKLNIKFDRILLDVPCSGNFATDKDWFKNRTIKDIEHNASLQREILSKTVECLSDDGEIVYSTCSLEPEEDELNIDWAIKNLNLQTQQIYCHGERGLTNIFGMQIDPSIKYCKRLWPGETQGFFISKLKRNPNP
jgi:NOL1/NOP2/sun family putative RNA methylase